MFNILSSNIFCSDIRTLCFVGLNFRTVPFQKREKIFKTCMKKIFQGKSVFFKLPTLTKCNLVLPNFQKSQIKDSQCCIFSNKDF